jgi:hypothetical protein
MVYIKLFGPVSVTKGTNMPNWKDELKAEIGDLMRSLDFDTTTVSGVNVIKSRTSDLKQVCALILELIDHIPEALPDPRPPFFKWEPPETQ